MDAYKLVENLAWAAFVAPSVGVARRGAVVRDLLIGGRSATSLHEDGTVSDPAAAAAFKAGVQAMVDSIDALDRHAARSRQPFLNQFLRESRRVIDGLLTRPSFQSYSTAREFAEHAEAALSDMRAGTYIDLATRAFLEEDRAVPDDSRAVVDLFESQYADRHQRFVSALEREFGITVHRFEPVAEGVSVYLDEDATTTMWEQLKSVNDVMNRIVDRHGYITLRRGSMDDIEWGGFPESYSRWSFAYCPASDPDSIGSGPAAVISKHKYAPVSL